MTEAHVFICLNKREAPRPCCGETISEEDYRELKVWSRTIPGLKLTGTRCMGVCPPNQCTLSINNKCINADDLVQIKRIITEEIK